MRTKTILLTATLSAVTIASTMAQVYSINTVGYVNVVCRELGKFTLIANPLDDGTNTLNSVLAGMPNKTTAYTWNGSAWNSTIKASGAFGVNASVPPGTAIFIKTPDAQATPVTNTFVGTVIPNSGQTNNVNLVAGFTPRGSIMPVSGLLNDVGVGKLNLNATIPNKSVVYTFDTAAQSYSSSIKASGAFGVNFPIAVGQAFFIDNKIATNWSQSLP